MTRFVAATAFSILALCLSGCNLTPKDATFIKVESNIEFYKATLLSEDVEPRHIVSLRWVDDNMWQTTATLSAGRYTFVSRGPAGEYFQQTFQVKGDTRTYQLRQETATGTQESVASPSGGSLVQLTIPGAFRQLNGREAFLVFTGNKVFVQRGHIGNNRLQVRIPEKGAYGVSLHIPGTPSYGANLGWQDFQGDHDFGMTQIRDLSKPVQTVQ